MLKHENLLEEVLKIKELEQELNDVFLEPEEPFYVKYFNGQILIIGIAPDGDSEQNHTEVDRFTGIIGDKDALEKFFENFYFEKHKHIQMLEGYMENFRYNLQEEKGEN